MTAKNDRPGRRSIGRLALAATLAAFVLTVAQPASAIESLNIALDQATILKLPERVATIVVGNPAIADVAVQAGGLAVVTGKGYGSTNIIVLDRAGAVLMEREVQVRGAGDNTVFVYRGVERESYSCMPTCERRITLGDSTTYFTATVGQTDTRNNQATGAAKPPGTK